MSTFIESIKDARSKRAAARTYVLAADRHREAAREERQKGHPDHADYYERIAADLTRNASFEVTS